VRLLSFLLLVGLSSSAQTQQITAQAERLAGSLPNEWPLGDGGPAADVVLAPVKLAFDRDGSLLIADSLNKRIRRLAADGTISTKLKYSDYGLQGVIGLALDSRGNLYLSEVRLITFEPPRIVRIAPDGRMSAIGDVVTSSAGLGIAIDALDNLYIADLDRNVVSKRSPEGVSRIVAGSGKFGMEGEGGPATQANLQGPRHVGIDRAGNLLIADSQRLLRVNADGTLVRLAGGNFSSLDPVGLAAAADGSVYVASVQERVWKWTPDGQFTIVAGNGNSGFNDGCALSGGLRVARNASIEPSDVALDSGGRLYIADGWSGRVRRVDPNGQISTVAGTGQRPRYSDAGGQANQQALYDPGAITVDGAGNVYFIERSANRVRQISPTGQLRTIAGTDSPPPGEDAACYSSPPGDDLLLSAAGIAVDSAGNLYIADTGHHRIRRRSPDGAITTIAGTGVAGQTGDGGPAIEAQLSSPQFIAVDSQGNIYFIEFGSRLRHISVDGKIESVASIPDGAGTVAFAPDGRMVVNSYKGLSIGQPGGTWLPLGVTRDGPVAVDPAGTIYAGSGPTRVTVRCNVALVSGNWGPATGLATDNRGALYIAGSDAIWRVFSPSVSGTENPSPINSAVRNAASNLFAQITIPGSGFHPPTVAWINDSIAPGEIVRLSGGCIGPLEPVSGTFLDGRLPASLAGVRVLVNGAAAPLLSVQSAEILAVIPSGAAATTGADLAIEYMGARTPSQALKVEPAVPGIFVNAGTQAAALNEDLTPNEADNPAAVGSIVTLFLTGAGGTDPALPDGAAAPDPAPNLVLPVIVRVGGAPAEVIYAGSAPGLVGVAQVNIRIPEISSSEIAPVQVSLGGITRNQSATLAVK
jgi:uncharacterized protein (TIGR03437 family)